MPEAKKGKKAFRPRVIIGIDPGVASTGYGVIKESGGQLQAVAWGCFSTKSKLELAWRLGQIYKFLKQLIKKYQPQEIAVEDIFFCKNVKTALQVGQARGVVLLTGQQSQAVISEYTPLQVKQALTGYGFADKRQIQIMVKAVLQLKELPEPDDAADALAVAICAAHSRRPLTINL